jgi:hypothetical protein
VNGVIVPQSATGAVFWSDELTLVAESSAVRCGRAFARLALAKWASATLEDDATLIVSELVTNAVTASEKYLATLVAAQHTTAQAQTAAQAQTGAQFQAGASVEAYAEPGPYTGAPRTPLITVRMLGLATGLGIEVWDVSPALPTAIAHRGDAEWQAEGGRGLRLVEMLAHRWGWRPAPRGKVVWAHLAHGGSVHGGG